MRFISVALFAVLVLQAAVAAPDVVQGPRLSDAQFFSLLDPVRPDLTEVRAAAAKQDWTSAKHLLAEHMRSRTMPRWDIDAHAVGKQPAHREPEADKALQHRLSSLGIEWQFGDKIDWFFNPTTQTNSQWARNHEWTWQLNRHRAWSALADAYYATGDEKYAREFVQELRSWVQDCPVPMDKAANGAFSAWRTIEAGIRAGTVWPQLLPRFLCSNAFDDEALTLMLKSWVDHADYLMKFKTHGNWLTMEANGLYHVGALFPEFKDAKLWRETALARLGAELDIQVYPDGAQIELAPGYHGVTIHNFLGPVRLVEQTGFPVPGNYLPRMEKMFEYLLFSMQPDRRTAPLNDSDANDVLSFLREGSKLFPNRQDFRWVATQGAEGQPPKVTSHEFPYAGQFIMRSGWDTEALWACMDGGPFGFGHQHEDMLSVILTAFGRALLVEGGVYTYDASDWRRYVLSSRAHNVVMVDGLEQNRRHEPRETYVLKNPLPHIWESNAQFDHAASRYEASWGPKAAKLARHTRHLFFVKPDLFVIADELEPLDGKEHSYESLFHLDAPEVKVDGLRVTTQGPGANLAIAAFGPGGVRIVKGQKNPVQGWLPDRGGYGKVRPIPTAIYDAKSAKTFQQIFVLSPSKGAANCPVMDANFSENRLRLRFPNGTEKSIPFQPFPAK